MYARSFPEAVSYQRPEPSNFADAYLGGCHVGLVSPKPDYARFRDGCEVQIHGWIGL